MDVSNLTAALKHDAIGVVFVNVLLQQLGLPVPAVPTLLIAGSLAVSTGWVAQLLAAALAASVLADVLWYLAGRSYGYRVLSGLCRLSLNPGSCVSRAESLFMRWGVWSLVFAKFVPGFATVGPPIAGAMGLPLSRFLTAATLGALLWAGAAMLVGYEMRVEVRWLMGAMDRHAGTAVAILAGTVGVWLAWKWLQRLHIQRAADVRFSTAADLLTEMDSAQPPLLLDLRGPARAALEGPVPGATRASLDTLMQAAAGWHRQRRIIAFCACPQDAAAVVAARLLSRKGYRNVRVLKAGDEWARSRRAMDARAPMATQHCAPQAAQLRGLHGKHCPQ
jgi:membrane protein DedA with SNARE-associated domain/rhodanese-related sulfurtransferase